MSHSNERGYYESEQSIKLYLTQKPDHKGNRTKAYSSGPEAVTPIYRIPVPTLPAPFKQIALDLICYSLGPRRV